MKIVFTAVKVVSAIGALMALGLLAAVAFDPAIPNFSKEGLAILRWGSFVLGIACLVSSALTWTESLKSRSAPNSLWGWKERWKQVNAFAHAGILSVFVGFLFWGFLPKAAEITGETSERMLTVLSGLPAAMACRLSFIIATGFIIAAVAIAGVTTHQHNLRRRGHLRA